VQTTRGQAEVVAMLQRGLVYVASGA
jgi:hypothetical protein